MEVFFKETIAGIIILGAIGSILAATVLWGVKKVVSAITPKLFQIFISITASIVLFLIGPGIKNQIKLYVSNNQNKLNAYYSSQKSQITISLIISTWVFMWLLVRLKFDGIDAFTIEAISYISIIFLTFGNAIRGYLSLLAPLIFDLDNMMEKSIEAMDPVLKKKYHEYKANNTLESKNR